MSSNVQPQASTPVGAPLGMRGEIAQKWGKFSPAEIAAIKDKEDLVAQVQSKYSLERAQAQTEVDAFAKGRSL